MRTSFPILTAILGFTLSAPLGAEAQNDAPAPRQRLISVSGGADVKVVPDQVIFTLKLTTSDADLAKAKLLNNERVKGVKAVAAQYKIDPKDVQIDFLSIEPNYGRRTFTVSRRLTVTLRQPARFDDVLTRMVQNNRANEVEGIDFRTTQLRKYRDQARLLAITAAREKAIALAGALGAKVGKPVSIREGANDAYSWYRYSGYYGGGGRAYAQNAQVSVNSSAVSGGSGGSYSPGQIAVNAQISVEFELE
ncbi:MAG TPA: SIMPL domain-containing protein [Abditibacterium sp.]|jgi:hypothetical protein